MPKSYAKYCRDLRTQLLKHQLQSTILTLTTFRQTHQQASTDTSNYGVNDNNFNTNLIF